MGIAWTRRPAVPSGRGTGGNFVVPPLDLEGSARVDDPGTEPNTGTGVPDHVDLGAYEYQP